MAGDKSYYEWGFDPKEPIGKGNGGEFQVDGPKGAQKVGYLQEQKPSFTEWNYEIDGEGAIYPGAKSPGKNKPGSGGIEE